MLIYRRETTLKTHTYVEHALREKGREARRLRQLARRLEYAAECVEQAGSPGYARKLREDRAWLIDLLA